MSQSLPRPADDRRAPPRILLAHDISPASDRATALLAGRAWPAGTVARIVTSSMDVGRPLSSFAGLPEMRTHTREVRHAISDAHDRAAAELRAAGVLVETATLHGKPARAIVSDAHRFEADVVVVGARDQPALAATLLGSVSRAVVETAPCSVLVARTASVGRVVLAVDGSPCADVATSIVASWPLFDEPRILLVGVGEPPPRYPSAVLDADEQLAAFGETIAVASDAATDVVAAAAEALVSRGRHVEREVRVGEPAAEILAAARAWAADLVAIGSNGGSLLDRLLVGGVTRAVLDGTGSSVLVARPRAGHASG